ncbi:hypothetical protein A4G99_12345 [Haladaptatus sp. R4]|uniref:hypothetical protein n=1 Tax=Haladaptatus sp. R4 TaxID=1679489 RepID=UPI0007B4DCA2|nr:hypothetical protein [Haladaptatus sp. R4]KZN23666.1 hypothetical protein A4G99_12345 [Haladaptatus sp. R4]
MVTGLPALLFGFVIGVAVSGIGAYLALRSFVYNELDLTKEEIRTAVKHLSYERMPPEEGTEG